MKERQNDDQTGSWILVPGEIIRPADERRNARTGGVTYFVHAEEA